MDVRQLEQEIMKIICEEYEAIYNRRLKVTKVDVDGISLYTLGLNLYGRERPATLSYQGTDEEFLAFIRQELRQKRLDRVDYWTGYRTECHDE